MLCSLHLKLFMRCFHPQFHYPGSGPSDRSIEAAPVGVRGHQRQTLWLPPLPTYDTRRWCTGKDLTPLRAELIFAWWRHQMEPFSALLALCAGNSPVTGEFTFQRPVTRSFVFFDLHLGKRLNKQSRRRWLDTQWHSFWRHCNGYTRFWRCFRRLISR